MFINVKSFASRQGGMVWVVQFFVCVLGFFIEVVIYVASQINDSWISVDWEPIDILLR
jgi:hypothetical protein